MMRERKPLLFRTPTFELRNPMDVRFSNRVSLSSSVFLSVWCQLAWVTLLYVAGLAECRAATSIGRTEEESFALGQEAEVSSGSI